MEPKGKLANNWKKEMWKSIDEDDVMQLRSKLNDIQIQTENELQSYNMNSAEEFET